MHGRSRIPNGLFQVLALSYSSSRAMSSSSVSSGYPHWVYYFLNSNLFLGLPWATINMHDEGHWAYSTHMRYTSNNNSSITHFISISGNLRSATKVWRRPTQYCRSNSDVVTVLVQKHIMIYKIKSFPEIQENDSNDFIRVIHCFIQFVYQVSKDMYGRGSR